MPKTLCLSVSKRNEKYLDIIEDYSMIFNKSKCETIFNIIQEYDDNTRKREEKL